MDIQRYGAEVKEPKLQHHIPEVKWTAKNRKEKEAKNEALKKAWGKIERDSAKAEEQFDVEEMHRL